MDPIERNEVPVVEHFGVAQMDERVIQHLVATSPTGAASGVGVSLNANNDVQLLAGATGLSVNAAADATAGNPFAVTITALDSNGNVDPAFQGTVGVSGAAGTVPALVHVQRSGQWRSHNCQRRDFVYIGSSDLFGHFALPVGQLGHSQRPWRRCGEGDRRKRKQLRSRATSQA